MILRAGIDMSSVSALARRAERSRNDFIGRYWSAAEIEQSGGSFSSLAARWSAKEAAMKALGAGIGKIDPAHIEVVLVDGMPTLRLHKSAKRRSAELGLEHWTVSLTHQGDWALASIVAMGGMGDDK